MPNTPPTSRDVFVIADEVYEHMVYDGVPHVSAASLDALAGQGAIFTDAHSTAAVCSPSRTSVQVSCSGALPEAVTSIVTRSPCTASARQVLELLGWPAHEARESTMRFRQLNIRFVPKRSYGMPMINAIAVIHRQDR